MPLRFSVQTAAAAPAFGDGCGCFFCAMTQSLIYMGRGTVIKPI